MQSFRSVSSDFHHANDAINIISIISTDEDPSLRIESSAIIKLINSSYHSLSPVSNKELQSFVRTFAKRQLS